MIKQASTLWQHLRRSLAPDPGRFPGGSAWIEPLSLLAVERERLTAQPRARHNASLLAADDERRGEAA